MLASRNSSHALLILLGFAIRVHLVQTEHILAVFSYAAGSPCLTVWPLLNALVQRGHQVTVISQEKNFPIINGAHHIRICSLDHLVEEIIDFDYDYDPMPTKWQHATWVAHFFHQASLQILGHHEVQQLLTNSSAHFDMVIMNTPVSDALSGFAKHFNALLVGIAAYGSAWNIDYLAGNSAPSVYEPMSPLGYTFSSRPTLYEKWNNWIHLTEEWLLERLVYLPPQIKLYRQYFNDPYSNFHEIRRNFSLILVNQHFSLGRVRSNVPSLIEVAGIHMCLERDCKLDPMPEDLQSFMDEAEHGVIYFSLGLEIIMKWLPGRMKQMLFETFSQLKQRVVWKYEDWESIGNKSDNIYVKSFLPQQQILNHPKIKLFISHGGLLSMIETVYYGVPILSLPLYYDQFANAQRMRLAGVGETLDLYSVNAQKLNQTIYEMLQNPCYDIKAKKMSRLFRDQPMTPLQTAVWWTEYILRHKDASHMRLAEDDMTFMQYYSVDLISVLFGRIGITAFIVILLGYKLTNIFIARCQISLSVPLIR